MTGKTCRIHGRFEKCIQNFSPETYRMRPLGTPKDNSSGSGTGFHKRRGTYLLAEKLLVSQELSSIQLDGLGTGILWQGFMNTVMNFWVL
jgi:hypothetical protein